jgi:hypothetical protein
MAMKTWLVEDGALTHDAILDQGGPRRAAGDWTLENNLAVFLKPLVVFDTRKLFGSAEIRLDVLVVHGGSSGTADLYHPQTFRFPRVEDGDNLAATDEGILVYYGRPEHFLVLSVMLSRDTKDSDDLASLIKAGAASEGLKTSLSALGAVIGPSVHAAAVAAGVGAALALGDLAYKLVRQTSPSCLGLFRASWLGNRHHFGIGNHPPTGAHEVEDFRFAYQVVEDEATPA